MTEFLPIQQLCMDCGQIFVIPPAEQRFRREHGIHNPESCPACRARLRTARNADLINRHERMERSSSTEAALRQRGKTTKHPVGSRQLYPAVCAACGAETRVPFIPRQDRPVYCRDCFNARQGR